MLSPRDGPWAGVLRPMKVLIADDHELLRQAMRLALSDEQLGLSFAEANGFDAAVETLAADRADLLLIDLSIPGMAGGGPPRGPPGVAPPPPQHPPPPPPHTPSTPHR